MLDTTTATGQAISEGHTEWLVQQYGREELFAILGNVFTYWNVLKDPMAILGLRLAIGPPDASMLYYATSKRAYRWGLRAMLGMWKTPLHREHFMGKPLRQLMFDNFTPDMLEPIQDFSLAAGYSKAAVARDILLAVKKYNRNKAIAKWNRTTVDFRIIGDGITGVVNVSTPSALAGDGIYEYSYTGTHQKGIQSISGTLPDGDWIPLLTRTLYENGFRVPMANHQNIEGYYLGYNKFIEFRLKEQKGDQKLLGLYVLGHLWQAVIYDETKKKVTKYGFETLQEAQDALIAL